jgi:hypothetical protein
MSRHLERSVRDAPDPSCKPHFIRKNDPVVERAPAIRRHPLFGWGMSGRAWARRSPRGLSIALRQGRIASASCAGALASALDDRL